MIDTDKKSQPRIEDIIGALNDGKERYVYVWVTTLNPAGFDEYAIDKRCALMGYYAILGKTLPESTILSIKVDGIQYVSAQLGHYEEDIFREEQRTVSRRSADIGIPAKDIINYKLLEKNDYDIWKELLFGTVDDKEPETVVCERLKGRTHAFSGIIA